MPGEVLPALGPLPPELRETDALHLGALGLTIGGSVGALVEYRLLRELVETRLHGVFRIGGPSRGRLAVATFAALVAAVLVRPIAVGLSPVLGGVVAVGVVATVHIGVAAAVGVPEGRALLGGVRRRVLRR